MPDYSFSERFLHKIVLGSNIVGQLSFDIEKFAGPTRLSESIFEHPVFISGLARAGTTIIMRAFNDTGQFRSLTYRDMPFVLMPGTWKKMSHFFHRHMDEKERNHGDGIYVNYDSPEAFEEIFWMTFCAKEYVKNNQLSPHSVSKETIDQFKLFVHHVISSGEFPNQQRYLSKNNNNILRLGSIREAFLCATIIVPFRSPLQHSFSLYQQHLRFCKQHSTNPFSSDYMRWLGHFEFGKNHKPFNFNGDDLSLSKFKSNDINYWVAMWIDTYRYLLKSAPEDAYFVSFESLCKSPDRVLRSLFNDSEITSNLQTIGDAIKPQKKKDIKGASESLTIEAEQLYQELLFRSEQLDSL